MNNKVTGWDSVSRMFHWGLDVAIIGMLAYGWWRPRCIITSSSVIAS